MTRRERRPGQPAPHGARGWWPRRLATALLTFAVIACTAQEARAPQAYDLGRATEMFSAGYHDIFDIFIDERQVSDLAMAGLGGLARIDPTVEIKRIGSLVAIEIDGISAGRYIAPEPQDAEGWAEVTASALDAGRHQSSALGAADAEQLYEAVFDAMVARLDPYSRYAGLEDARENRASRDGFGGIGVRIRMVENGVKILSVMEDTPAQAAGLKSNDIITRIGDEPAAGLSQRQVVRRLRGPVRTRVNLTIERPSEPKALALEVTRAHVVPQTVEYRAEGNFAYFRITSFNQSTAETLEQRLRAVIRRGASAPAGVILDFRNNPGGLLDQAVAVADLFVGAGRIVSTRGRHPDSEQYFDAESDDPAGDLPVAILINGSSASASEIVAAALQDSGRAVVIGSNSFGKGTVQTVLRLPNEGELTLTWARFHAPSGYGLHRRGVLPNICTNGQGVASAGDVLDLLHGGRLPIESAALRRHIDPDDDVALEALRATCPLAEDENEIDLEVARRLLASPALYARALGSSEDSASRAGGQPHRHLSARSRSE